MPLGCHLSGWMACNCLNMWFSYILTWFSFFINIWVVLLCSGDTKLFHDIAGKVPLLLNIIKLPWYQCLACLFWQCTFHQHWPSPLTFGCIHIFPRLLWCIISDMKCCGAHGKLGNNMGGSSPPPLLSDQASGFLPSIYKGTLFSLPSSFWIVKQLVSSVLDATGYLFNHGEYPPLLSTK